MAKLFDGTDAVTASVLDKDIVADFVTSKGWESAKCRMEFFPEADMLLSINGSADILFKDGDEIEEDEIWSLILREASKDYRFFAMYETKDVISRG